MRKAWRRDHPFGFQAKPSKRPDGSQNLFQWKCLVPGPPGTDWAPENTTYGHYPVRLEFGTDYPSSPPTCYFDANFFHPNVSLMWRTCRSAGGGHGHGGELTTLLARTRNRSW